MSRKYNPTHGINAEKKRSEKSKSKIIRIERKLEEEFIKCMLDRDQNFTFQNWVISKINEELKVKK